MKPRIGFKSILELSRVRHFGQRAGGAVVFVGIVALLLATVPDLLPRLNVWERANGALIDLRYGIRGIKPANPNLVLVGVTDTSLTLSELGSNDIKSSEALQLMARPYPWDRRVWAATLDKLMSVGAKVVVFDLVFANSSDADADFAKTLAKYPGRVILGATMNRASGILTGPNLDLENSVTTNQVGFVEYFPDDDGINRRGTYRTSLEREYHDKRLDKFIDQYPDNIIHLTARAVKSFSGDVYFPPHDHDNMIDFEGPKNRYIPIPIENLFVDSEWNGNKLKGGQIFRNKIVIVGPIATVFHDIQSTAMGEMPGPELQAEAISTLLRRTSLSEPSPTTSVLLSVAMTILAVAICLGIRNAALKPALMIGTLLGFVVACQLAFSHQGLVIDMMPPLFVFIVTASFGLIFNFILEQVERRHTLNVLERYVSKNIAKFILEDQRTFVDSLSGRKQSVTVLFSDIRGFTGMAEERDPTELVKQLNEYFLEMVGIVYDEAGSLQKFIGDALMAAWGDVYSKGAEEDARRAVRAALRMRAELVKLNARWEGQPNRVPLQIGMGVNMGEMVVGNIGHPQRMEFTVLGDGVNLAARLETATKQFCTNLLVGESVEAIARGHFIFRSVGSLTVKGKTKPVEAFDVLGERPQPDPKWLADYHEGIALFRKRQFDAAAAKFKTVAAEIGGEDYLCEFYLGWCATYAKQPPPPDWNGSIILSEK